MSVCVLKSCHFLLLFLSSHVQNVMSDRKIMRRGFFGATTKRSKFNTGVFKASQNLKHETLLPGNDSGCHLHIHTHRLHCATTGGHSAPSSNARPTTGQKGALLHGSHRKAAPQSGQKRKVLMELLDQVSTEEGVRASSGCSGCQ